MEFGCSQCLAAAIESHRLDLVRQLLQRPVGYRDIFWMPCPRAWMQPYSFFTKKPEWGRHPLSQDVDIERIGSAVCGHEVFDEEICTPGIFTRPLQLDDAKRILASLPILARWNNTDVFPILQMLRDSGKFDFNEPQFYHYIDSNCNIVFSNGPIINDEFWIHMHIEMDAPSVNWSCVATDAPLHQHYNRSINICARNIIRGVVIKPSFVDPQGSPPIWSLFRVNSNFHIVLNLIVVLNPFNCGYIGINDYNDMMRQLRQVIQRGSDINAINLCRKSNMEICSLRSLVATADSLECLLSRLFY